MADDFRGGAQAVNPWIIVQKNFLLLLYWVYFVPIFLKIFSKLFFLKFNLQTEMKSKHCFYSDFSFLMQLYTVKYIKCLTTRKYSLQHKCE